MSGLDGLLLGNAEAIDCFTLDEMAMMRKLPEELSITNIAKLTYSDNRHK